MRITIGHLAYPSNGVNRYAVHYNKYDALCDLISRSIDGKVAVTKINEAVANKGKFILVAAGAGVCNFVEIRREK